MITLRAHAKVNLRLRVLAREASGYHQIETLFLLIDLADDVRVRVDVPGRSLDCRGADVGPVERNLAWRAAMAMREAGGPSSFSIEIDKRIPVGGGLGGGSADAAAVLRALNALRATPLPPDELLSLGASLGSDIPFLTSSVPYALAWGRGERLLTLPPPAPAEVLLAVPAFGVATADAYAWLAETPRERERQAVQLDPASLCDWPALRRHAGNDFEPVVERRHPELAVTRTALTDAGAAIARLSGSGSTIFGVFPDGLDEARRITLERASPGMRLLRTRTLARAVGGEPAGA